jgi:hypothetical protein
MSTQNAATIAAPYAAMISPSVRAIVFSVQRGQVSGDIAIGMVLESIEDHLRGWSRVPPITARALPPPGRDASATKRMLLERCEEEQGRFSSIRAAGGSIPASFLS